ncbi:glycosyltransferase [Yimella sp. cx-51]|nr:glycosyltransferase [Yimella sp. cx-51]QTH39502.1 glycosyltransferase [Yimella sp. cx-51]
MSHSAVVGDWRARERWIRSYGIHLELLSARQWNEGGRNVPLRPAPDESVTAVGTVGRHPALFLYDPRPLWRHLRQSLDILDVHEEPFALATAEILLLRRLARQTAPYLLYSAQNIDKRYPPPFRWLERWALRHASGVHVCNSEAGRIVERKGFPGVSTLLGLGIDTAVFAPRTRHRPTTDTVNVGYAGRFEPHKGVRVLLQALVAEPRLRLGLAGAGTDEAVLRAMAADLGIESRVTWHGSLSGPELAEFYRRSDVLAVPSLTTPGWVEQFGRVAVEAMACGTPVVASAGGALPEVIRDGGLIVPESDPRALASALLRAGTEPERSRIGDAAAARGRSYDWRHIANQQIELYRRILHEPHSLSGRRVHVVLVAYGSPELVDRALTPLAGFDITVVDNSSRADVAAVAERHEATYVDPGHNGGFAAGVNAALARREGDGADVLLLNPDAVISAEQVRILHTRLLADPGLASVAPAQHDKDGKPSRVAWPLPSPARSVMEAIGLGRLGRQDTYSIGSIMLLRSEALGQVGGFDERFFLYAEETDWARRAVQLGWRHGLINEVDALHIGAATSSDPSMREAHFHASQEIFHRKHFGTFGWQVARWAQIVGSAARGIVLPGDRGLQARDRALRYLRGPLRVRANAVRTSDETATVG